MKKILSYALMVAALFLVAYNSIFFRKLDRYKASASKSFDATRYARNYFDRKLLPALGQAIDINQLLAALQSNKAEAFDQYSHALGIGNIRFFMVKGQGVVTGLNPDHVTLQVSNGAAQRSLEIATEFVFGNAIRDASGRIDINEFENTMDFNNVSAEVNKIVRTEVLPPFKRTVKKGDRVQFSGAIELNREHLNLEHIEVVPVELKLEP